jgi:hypothetical protein
MSIRAKDSMQDKADPGEAVCDTPAAHGESVAFGPLQYFTPSPVCNGLIRASSSPESRIPPPPRGRNARTADAGETSIVVAHNVLEATVIISTYWCCSVLLHD